MIDLNWVDHAESEPSQVVYSTKAQDAEEDQEGQLRLPQAHKEPAEDASKMGLETPATFEEPQLTCSLTSLVWMPLRNRRLLHECFVIHDNYAIIGVSC